MTTAGLWQFSKRILDICRRIEMGLRGPKPLDLKTLQLRGSGLARGRKEKLREQPSQSLAGLLSPKDLVPPEGLPKKGKEFWKSYCEDLIEDGTLNAMTISSFSMLCQSWADYWQSVEAIKKKGSLIQNTRGGQKKHPAILIREKSLEQFTKLAKLFGIVPC
jgi:P27 family predicted phage terminase small subunit